MTYDVRSEGSHSENKIDRSAGHDYQDLKTSGMGDVDSRILTLKGFWIRDECPGEC